MYSAFSKHCRASQDTSDDLVTRQTKSIVAPLLKSQSKEEENSERFLTQFEGTIRYNHAEYDKILLLEQQISGRALALGKSSEM